MAARYCDNCGRPVLQTDSTCWHCGVKLASSGAGNSQPPAPRPAGKAAPTERAPHALLYAALTAVVAVALLFVTASLGRRPLLLQGLSGGTADWVALRAQDGSYDIAVPADWSWQQATSHAAQEDLAMRIAASRPLQVALNPVAQIIDEADILLLAHNGDSFLILGRSSRLAGVSVTDLVGALRNESFPTATISQTSAVANEAGQPAALLVVTQEEPPLECRQLILPGTEQGYLAAACAPARQSGEQEALFMTMLSSLQIRD